MSWFKKLFGGESRTYRRALGAVLRFPRHPQVGFLAAAVTVIRAIKMFAQVACDTSRARCVCLSGFCR